MFETMAEARIIAVTAEQALVKLRQSDCEGAREL